MTRLTISFTQFLRSLWHRLPFQMRIGLGKKIRFITEPLLAASIPRAAKNPLSSGEVVTILGLFSSPIGHGIAAILLETELQKAGFTVNRIDATSLVGAPVEGDALQNPEEINIGDTLIVVLNPDIAIHAISKLGTGLLTGKRVIGYWVWELERIPRFWSFAGRFVHEIWTPSHFSAAALRKSFKVPVHVVPHAAALRSPILLDEGRRRAVREKLGISDQSFVVLQSFSFASSLSRKNAIGAISAFVAACHDIPDARLVIRYLSDDRFPISLSRLRAAAQVAGSQVILVSGKEGLEDLHDMYAASDAYISLHRSEGFGLNLAEVMLLGKPLMATNWSGNLDFMDRKCVVLVNADLVTVSDPDKVYSQRYGRWAEPRMDEAVRWLRRLAKEPALRARLADEAKVMAKERLSGGAAAILLQGNHSKGA